MLLLISFLRGDADVSPSVSVLLLLPEYVHTCSALSCTQKARLNRQQALSSAPPRVDALSVSNRPPVMLNFVLVLLL